MISSASVRRGERKEDGDIVVIPATFAIKE